MTRSRTWILTVFLAGLVACSEKPKENPQVFETVTWSPEAVQVQCPSGDCPEGVGLVTFVQRLADRSKIGRCTASLVSPSAILTNAHCLKLLEYYDEAYFFVRHNGQMVFRPLVNVNAVGESPSQSLGRDFALLALGEPILDLRPLTLAREIPEQLPIVVAFVINGVEADSSRLKYTLDKKTCETESHVGLLKLGYKDRGVALGLFGCSVVKGNSGSPVFAPGNFTRIELLVTSTYSQQQIKNYFGDKDPFAQTYWEVPRFKQADFPAAERLHCLDLPGFPEPKDKCDSSVNQAVSFDMTSQLHKISAAWIEQKGQKNGVLWGLDADALGSGGGGVAPALTGLALKPRPICRLKGTPNLPTKVNHKIEDHRIGLRRDGELQTHIERETEVEIAIPKNLPLCGLGVKDKAKATAERALIIAYEKSKTAI